MMGYGSVVMVVGAIILSGVLLLSMNRATADADEKLNEYHFDELSRDAATTGLQLTVRKLAADAVPNSWTDPSRYEMPQTAFGSGSFRTEVTIPNPPVVPDVEYGDQVDVVARGFNGPGNQVIFARYIREYADGGIPPSFRNAITVDEYLQIQGDVYIGTVDESLNANIHTNHDLFVQGNSITVEGYGSYSGSLRVRGGDPEDNFIPNVDINGEESNLINSAEIEIPSINLERLREIALTTSGATVSMNMVDGAVPPVTIDGDDPLVSSVLDFTQPATLPWLANQEEYNYSYTCASGSCGTAENPFVLVVEGPLRLVNTVRVLGYGIIVATGEITIDPQGSGGGVYGELNDELRTQVLLAAANPDPVVPTGDITVISNPCLGRGPDSPQGCEASQYTHGISLYAERNVTFLGTPYLVGGIVAKNTSFDGGGTPDIVYGAPSESITDPGFEFVVPIGPILVAYSEW